MEAQQTQSVQQGIKKEGFHITVTQMCITAVFMSVTDALTACVLAAAVLGISGELADDSRGLGTYHIGLIDSLSLMDSEKLLAHSQEELVLRWQIY